MEFKEIANKYYDRFENLKLVEIPNEKYIHLYDTNYKDSHIEMLSYHVAINYIMKEIKEEIEEYGLFDDNGEYDYFLTEDELGFLADYDIRFEMFLDKQMESQQGQEM